MHQTISEAVELHKAGRLADATEIYKSVLAREPENADAWHLLGLVAHQGGNPQLALMLLDKAVECNPGLAHYHADRGTVLTGQGQLHQALLALDEALRLKPDYPQAQFNRGVVLEKAGQLEEALAAYGEALRLQPDYPQAHNNRGVVLQRLGRPEEALAAFERTVRFQPDNTEAHFNRGGSLKDLGRLDEALGAYEQALRLKPDYPEAHNGRGLVLDRLGRFEEALAAYDQALRLRPAYALAHLNRGAALERLGRAEDGLAAYDAALRVAPDLAQAHVNRGAALARQSRFDDALAAYDRASAIDPNLAEAHVNRGAALARLGRVAEALASLDRGLRIRPDDPVAHLDRGNLLMYQARFGEALAAYRHAVCLKPDYAEARSNYLFCMNYDPAQDDAALFEAHRQWGERFGRSPHAFAAHDNAPDPDKVLRVGLVSADFGRHPIGFFLDGVLPAADPTRVQYVCYSGRLQEDDLTGRLRAHAAGWRSSIGLSDRALAETVRADGIDVLIDLAGHTAGGRLGCFALRPAPVLVHWAGSTHTIPAVDYSLWDWIHVPAGDERWFVETVVRLPDARVCYKAPPYAPEVTDPPVLARGHITFGSFNNLAKLNPGVVGLWTRVLETVPGSRLMLNWPTLADPGERRRVAELFAARGIEPGRLELTPGEGTHAGVLGQYGEIDIALDAFPFSGCTTTCEALWMGVPVLTLPGTRPVSRQSQAFLTALGRSEWIARDAADYLRIAAGLAADPQRLAALRREQRARVAASPVGDGRRFAANLEAALRGMWRRWCDPGRLPLERMGA